MYEIIFEMYRFIIVIVCLYRFYDVLMCFFECVYIIVVFMLYIKFKNIMKSII